MTLISPERYHGLDALRATAMLFGIVIHALLPYTEPEIMIAFAPETAGDPPPEASKYWFVLILWIHQWRMPVFFLLAGFFAALVIERKGPAAFLADRSLRLLGALILFLTLITLITDKPWAELHHLWFIWFLVQFCAVAIFAHWIRLGAAMRPTLWIFGSLRRMALILIVMVPLTVFAKENFLLQVIPKNLWDFAWQGLLYYGFFFVIGIGLWNRRERIKELAAPAIWGTLIGISTCVLILLAVLRYIEADAPVVFALSIPIGQFALIFGLIGAAHALVRAGGPVLTFLVESSYAVYIVHVYIIMGVSVQFILAGYSSSVVVPLSIAITLLLSISVYVIFVRYTPLDWVMAGPKKARFRWPFGPFNRLRSQG
ncbi:MAG: acyltransferase family protein [Pseudomonadota bacterium]